MQRSLSYSRNIIVAALVCLVFLSQAGHAASIAPSEPILSRCAGDSANTVELTADDMAGTITWTTSKADKVAISTLSGSTVAPITGTKIKATGVALGESKIKATNGSASVEITIKVGYGDVRSIKASPTSITAEASSLFGVEVWLEDCVGKYEKDGARYPGVFDVSLTQNVHWSNGTHNGIVEYSDEECMTNTNGNDCDVLKMDWTEGSDGETDPDLKCMCRVRYDIENPITACFPGPWGDPICVTAKHGWHPFQLRAYRFMYMVPNPSGDGSMIPCTSGDSRCNVTKIETTFHNLEETLNSQVVTTTVTPKIVPLDSYRVAAPGVAYARDWFDISITGLDEEGFPVDMRSRYAGEILGVRVEPINYVESYDFALDPDALYYSGALFSPLTLTLDVKGMIDAPGRYRISVKGYYIDSSGNLKVGTIRGSTGITIMSIPENIAFDLSHVYDPSVPATFSKVPFDLTVYPVDANGDPVPAFGKETDSINITLENAPGSKFLSCSGQMNADQTMCECVGQKYCNGTRDTTCALDADCGTAGYCRGEIDSLTSGCSGEVMPIAPAGGVLVIKANATWSTGSVLGTKNLIIDKSYCSEVDVLPPNAGAPDANVREPGTDDTIDVRGLLADIVDDNEAIADRLVNVETVLDLWLVEIKGFTQPPNATVCAYGTTKIRAEVCVGQRGVGGPWGGMFSGDAGILCIRQLAYNPQVDGMISDHYRFKDNDLSKENLMSTIKYPELLWTWGFQPSPAPNVCVNGYRVESLTLEKVTPVEFNMTTRMNGDASLPPYNMVAELHNNFNPHKIHGISALFALKKYWGDDNVFLYQYDASSLPTSVAVPAEETYPMGGNDLIFTEPNALAVDTKGNVYAADTVNGRIVVFKPMRDVSDETDLVVTGVIPADGGVLTSKHGYNYYPLGIATDSWNKLYIVGLTRLGSETDKTLVIDVWATIPEYAQVASLEIPLMERFTELELGGDIGIGDLDEILDYMKRMATMDTASIGVDSRGINIYVGADWDQILQFTLEGETITPAGEMNIWIPCRQIGPGCWSPSCLGSRVGGELLKSYDRAFCYYKNDDGEDLGYLYGTKKKDSMLECEEVGVDWGVSGGVRGVRIASGSTVPQGICIDYTMSRRPEYDGPMTDKRGHQIEALFYRKGYVFLIDRFSYTRKENYGATTFSCALNSCDSGFCGDCWSWTELLFEWKWHHYDYDEVFTGTAPERNCNYCSGDTTYVRTEYWLRVYYESETGGLTPIFHGAFGTTGGQYGGGTGGVNWYDAYNHDGPGLWAGDTVRGSYIYGEDLTTATGDDESIYEGWAPDKIRNNENDYYGWDWTATAGFAGGGGDAALLNIADDGIDRATGLFVDENFNVYFTIRGSASLQGVWHMKLAPTPLSGTVAEAAERLVNEPDLSAVAVFPDVIATTASLGVYCEGCSDKASFDLDVCEQEQETASLGRGRGGEEAEESCNPLSEDCGEMIPATPNYNQVWLSTQINGTADVRYTATIVGCSPATSGTYTGTVIGNAQTLSNRMNATIEGGLFHVVFTRPYRSSKSPAPQVLPTLDYDVYSSRYLFKHFVVLDNVTSRGAGNEDEPVLVNATYRFNFTKWRNLFYGYTFATSSIDEYNDVPSQDPADYRYDSDASGLFPIAGYENVTLNWSIPAQYEYIPGRLVPNPLPLGGAGAQAYEVCSCNAVDDCTSLPAQPLTFTVSGINGAGSMATATYLSDKPCDAGALTPAGTWQRIDKVSVRNDHDFPVRGGFVASGSDCDIGCLYFNQIDEYIRYAEGTTKLVEYPAIAANTQYETPTDPMIPVAPDLLAPWWGPEGTGMRLSVHAKNVSGECGIMLMGYDHQEAVIGSAQVTGRTIANPIIGDTSIGLVSVTAGAGGANVIMTFRGYNPSGGFASFVHEASIAPWEVLTYGADEFSEKSMAVLTNVFIQADLPVSMRIEEGGTPICIESNPYLDDPLSCRYVISETGYVEADPPSHFVPGVKYYQVIPLEEDKVKFLNVVQASGTGTSIGDVFEVYSDPEELLPIKVIRVGAGAGGVDPDTDDPLPGSANMTAKSLLPGLDRYPDSVYASSHKYVCCNHTNRTFAIRTVDICESSAEAALAECYVKQDALALEKAVVCGATDEDANAACVAKSGGSWVCDSIGVDATKCADPAAPSYCDCTRGGICNGNVVENENKCEDEGERFYCRCQYKTDPEEVYYSVYPYESYDSCGFCNRSETMYEDCYEENADGDRVARADLADDSCNLDGVGWYVLGGSVAEIKLYGIDVDYNPAYTLDFDIGGAAADAAAQMTTSTGKPLRAVFRIEINTGWNETINFTNSTGGKLLTVPVNSSAYVDESSLVKLNPPEPRTLAVKSNLPSSTAEVRIIGLDKHKTALVEEPISLVGMDDMYGATNVGTELFSAIYRIEVTGADVNGEIINVTTGSKGGDPQLLGTVVVSPQTFMPSTHQNSSGTFFFANKDIVNFKIGDNESLGYHNANWTFFDRFANTFIWDQPFDFKLPTKIVLSPVPRRDNTDANLTRIVVRAKLLYADINEADLAPSHPLGGETLTFWEWNVTRYCSAGTKATCVNDLDCPVGTCITEEFVRERNWKVTTPPSTDENTPCTCGETTCKSAGIEYPCFTCFNETHEGVVQKACTDSGDCASPSACKKPRFCTSDVECPSVHYADLGVTLDSECIDTADYPGYKVCSNSGRCLQNFGWVGTNDTCDEIDGCDYLAYGETQINYSVCGWGKHRLVALFDPPPDSVFARAMEVQPYYSGGFPLDVGKLALWLPVALILALIAAKIYGDWRAGRGAQGAAS